MALACAKLGQLLVWDWRAETYVLKQQGHYYDVSAVAYSPDGALLVSGADDSKVGFCWLPLLLSVASCWRKPLAGCHILLASTCCRLHGNVHSTSRMALCLSNELQCWWQPTFSLCPAAAGSL